MDNLHKGGFEAPFSAVSPEDMAEPSPPPGGGGEGRKEGLVSVLLNSLPPALTKVVVKSFLFAFGCLLAGVFFAVALRELSPLVFLLIGAWLAWSGLSILLDYRAGKIVERTVVCTGVAHRLGEGVMGKKMSRRITVAFRDVDEGDGGYYQYILPAGVAGDFIVSAVYATYVRAHIPQVLLAYTMM